MAIHLNYNIIKTLKEHRIKKGYFLMNFAKYKNLLKIKMKVIIEEHHHDHSRPKT